MKKIMLEIFEEGLQLVKASPKKGLSNAKHQTMCVGIRINDTLKASEVINKNN